MTDPGTLGLLTYVIDTAIGLAVLLYFVPSIVAFSRLHPNRYPILVLNLAFGWTGMGWIGTLVWAVWATRVPNEESGARRGARLSVRPRCRLN